MASRSRWFVGSSSSSRSERTHERLRHVQAHAPAAGEIAHRARLIVRGEPESVHELRGARPRVVTAAARVLRVEVRELDAVVVRGFGARDQRLELAQPRVAVEHEIERLAVGGLQILRDMRHLQVGGHLEVPRIRVDLAEHQRHQARLAAAVLAGDADLLAAEQSERGFGNEDPGATAQGEVVEGDHPAQRLGGACPDSKCCAGPIDFPPLCVRPAGAPIPGFSMGDRFDPLRSASKSACRATRVGKHWSA